jgi:hypothetical protein
MRMTGRRWASVVLLVMGAAILVWLGGGLSQAKPLGGLDFRALYEGAAVLIHRHDPFNPSDVRAYYVATGDAKLYPEWALYTLALLNYPPITYLFTAPFALLPWHVAQGLWTGLTTVSLLAAAFVMWRRAEKDAPLVAGCLIGYLLSNSEVILGGGNAAGLAVSLCILGTWCWVERRWEWVGVGCLAVSLAMKPHDGGLVWLYFLLLAGRLRRLAVQTLALDVLLGVGSVLWIWQVAPNWFSEMRQVMAVYSAHGGANDPGILGSPTSSFRAAALVVYPGMVCSLQSIAAVFWDEPTFYNPFTYLFCAVFIVVWARATLRQSFSKERAYLALASIVPFTLLITYHRTTDVKLLLLTVPACAVLWSRGGPVGKLALVLTGLAIFVSGDISLILLGHLVGNPDWIHASWLQKIPYVLMYRPVPALLLANGLFYLWVYVKGERNLEGTSAMLPPLPSEA